jgi:hypothetical protein
VTDCRFSPFFFRVGPAGNPFICWAMTWGSTAAATLPSEITRMSLPAHLLSPDYRINYNNLIVN